MLNNDVVERLLALSNVFQNDESVAALLREAASVISRQRGDLTKLELRLSVLGELVDEYGFMQRP